MNAPDGSANVMIVPPKYMAGPSARGSADTDIIPSSADSSAHVEQQPEYERDDREVVPHEREGAEPRLEALHLERLLVGRRLLHEGDGRDVPRLREQDLQPDHRTQPDRQRHRVEPDEDARETRLAGLERQVEQLPDGERDGREA